MKIALSCISLVFLVGLSFSATLFDQEITSGELPLVSQEIQKALSTHTIVRATFVQQKDIVALKTTLETSGQLLFAKDRGIVWEVVDPLAMKLVMSDTRGMRIEEGDTTQIELSAFQSAKMYSLMDALYSGDLSALTKVFSLYYEHRGNSWNLGLMPRRGSLARFLQSITITGDTLGTISKVVIATHEGGSTKFLFTPTEHSHTPLTSAEKSLFDAVVSQ